MSRRHTKNTHFLLLQIIVVSTCNHKIAWECTQVHSFIIIQVNAHHAEGQLAMNGLMLKSDFYTNWAWSVPLSRCLLTWLRDSPPRLALKADEVVFYPADAKSRFTWLPSCYDEESPHTECPLFSGSCCNGLEEEYVVVFIIGYSELLLSSIISQLNLAQCVQSVSERARSILLTTVNVVLWSGPTYVWLFINGKNIEWRPESVHAG